MKKIIICLLLVIISTTTFSQQTNPVPQLTKQDYLQKSKKQKTTAWILLGGGAALSITAVILSVHTVVDFFTLDPATKSTANATLIFALTGTAAMLGSIPLFVSSGKNKRKAMSLSFKLQQIPQLHQTSIAYYPIPSLKLKIIL